jgi:hypothetical protein
MLDILLSRAHIIHVSETNTNIPSRAAPAPEEAVFLLRELMPIWPSIVRALEAGTIASREYFDTLQRPVDPFLFPNIVRYHAAEYLREVALAEGVDYEFETLPNNGLKVCFGPYRLRILKADHGDLPVPGHSRSKQFFYQQRFEQQLLFGEAMMNLVVLWDVDGRGNLTRLDLVRPVAGEETRSSVLYDLRVPIPHPAEREEPAAHEVEPDLPVVRRRFPHETQQRA